LKKIILILFCLLVIIYSCNVVDTNYGAKIAGNYTGTYSLTQNVGSDSSFVLQSPITFKFTLAGTYIYEGSYQSSFGYLPPGGIGRYIIDYKFITLTDTVGHPDNLDPSLILNGKFDYTLRGNNLTLSKNDTIKKRYHKIEIVKQN